MIMRRQNSRSQDTVRAFTLLELILVVAIIGLLSTLLFPAIATMTDRARAQKCMNNLRQIGASAHLYANEHENRFPRIEVSPDEPIYPPDEEVKPILETLQPYGVTEAVLQCAADLRGPNWYAKRQTSYLWDPRAEDELTNAIKVYRRGRASVRRQAVVQLATDYEAVHPADAAGARKRMNILYADGHVKLR